MRASVLGNFFFKGKKSSLMKTTFLEKTETALQGGNTQSLGDQRKTKQKVDHLKFCRDKGVSQNQKTWYSLPLKNMQTIKEIGLLVPTVKP